jgi:hypothetical protein
MDMPFLRYKVSAEASLVNSKRKKALGAFVRVPDRKQLEDISY